MFTEASFRLLLGCHCSSDLALNFDAIRSVILESYGQVHSVYSLIRTNAGYSFPLASMRSQTGKAADILRLFLNVRRPLFQLRFKILAFL